MLRHAVVFAAFATFLISPASHAMPWVDCVAKDNSVSARIYYNPLSDKVTGWKLQANGKSYESSGGDASLGQHWITTLDSVRFQFFVHNVNEEHPSYYMEYLFMNGEVKGYLREGADSGRKPVMKQPTTCE